MKHFTLFLFLLLGWGAGFAQSYKIAAEDQQQFITDVKAMMAGTKNEAAIQVANGLETAWNSGKVSASQKAKVMDLTQQMLKRKLKSRPHFEHFFGALASGVNVHQYTGGALDQFLNVTEQTLQKQDAKVYEKFLTNAHQFLDSKTLFKGPTNGLRVLGGSFAFEYRDGTAIAGAAGAGWGEEPEVAKEAPAPEKPAAAKPAAAKTAPKKAAPKKADPWDDWEAPKAVAAEDDPWAAWEKPKKKTVPKKTTASKSAKAATPTKEKAPAKPTGTPIPKEEAAPVVPKFEYMADPLPVLAGPVVVLNGADLFFTTPFDSVTIKGTSGAMSLDGKLFVGQGGKYVWNTLGGDATAEFKGLAIDVSKAGFKAEDVTLTFPAVLDNSIRGNLEYKMVRPNAKGEKAYPRFISHTNDAKIKRFGADIQYTGGMSLSGSTLMSAALDGSPSTIWVLDGAEKKFRASSRNYTISDSLITAPVTSITLLQGQDSITHPGVKFKYNKDAKRLVLLNADGVYKTTPYYHSYNQVELATDMAVWNIQKPQIDFAILTAKNQVPAQVNSKEYFTETRFQQIKTISNFHPLYAVVGYGTKLGKRSFYMLEMAEETKIRPETLHNALTTLVQGNYVDYDPSTGYVYLKEKAYHHVDASRDKRDYDYIHLNALSPAGKNATLDMTTGELLLRGVKKFAFTGDSSVIAEPDSQIVRIQKNRNILFNGRVKSANFTFKGQEFVFDYDGFFVDLAKIDSTVLTTQSKDKDGKVKETPFTLVNRGGQGKAKLYLNRPDNKSGRKKVPGYPSLDAVSGATVYFNKPEILGGVYDTSVYFSIPPFKIDSITSAKSAIGFNGTFYSGGIFPPFDTKLSIQPDGALGFEYVVPKNGFAVYGGKGHFNDTVTMNTKGLRGKGVLTYQTATMHSPGFVFFVDSAVTEVGTKGSFKAGSVAQGSYPSGSFKSFRMDWWPYRDTLEVHSKGKELMSMFNDRFTYKGMLGFTPSALFGDGVAESKEVAIKSPLFMFKKGLIHGNRASMEVNSSDKKVPALTTYDVFLDFYLDDGYAQYAPERKGFASTVFPLAQYKSSLGGGRWDFKTKKLTLSSGNEDLNTSYFYSMKSGPDSLRFKATGAVYDLSDFTLVASGVPYIPVGDSYLIPDSNQVHILKDAKLKTFQNAGIAMDSVQKHHQMVRGEVHLDNAFGLTGNAIYKFTNSASEAYNIKFDNFAWNQPAQDKKAEKKGEAATPYFLASATVKETDTLFILPNVRYYGEIKLMSNQKLLNFDGHAKLLFSGNESSDWFPYKRDGLNPEDVRLEIKDPKLADGTPLKTGIHVSTATGKIYNTFVTKKQDDTDLDVFEVEGLLSFNKEEKKFKLGDEGRAYGNSYTGNVLKYNDATKEVTYEGKFKLIEPVKGFDLQVAGSGSGRTDSSLYQLDTFMAFNFDVPAQAVESMAKIVAKNAEGAPEAVDLNSPTLPYKLAAFIGDKGVEDFKAKTASTYVPFAQVSSKLVHSLVLNDVKLKWSPQTNAWYSVGPLSVAGIGKTDINAKMNGYIEIKRGASGDVVSLYLEPTPYSWYYLNFYEGGLGLTAADGDFNSIIANKSKGGPGSGSYNFYPVEQVEKMEFVNYFRKTYLGKGPVKEVVQPTIDTFASADEEEASGKKAKKSKKNKKDEATDAMPPGFDTPPAEEAPAEKSKKEKKKKEETQPAADIPVAAPATEGGSEKNSKKDKKKKEEVAPAPDIPVAEPEEGKKEKKKKKKKEEEETPPDIQVGN
ncbi:hypothetical protein [Rufibacter quisquiliarum]|uniref:Uncharacterized protein n=1 Tax=Rufibacter quisquiliarum TaxID=1549639 RepID=A0A839GP41_9BACT|nr:hypothetical protein [Rufibacter quisquiliarum]MBA9076208.1 hypothetical protein [Rufibacter quisquiliarum]